MTLHALEEIHKIVALEVCRRLSKLHEIESLVKKAKEDAEDSQQKKDELANLDQAETEARGQYSAAYYALAELERHKWK